MSNLLILHDLKVMTYELEYDPIAQHSITLARVPGRNCERWAIRNGGFALGKIEIDGIFLFALEPMPSSRDEAYYREYRWSSAVQALRFWNENRHRIVATYAEKRARYARAQKKASDAD